MFRRVTGLLSAPPTIAHELTHFVAAKLAGTDDAEIAVEVLDVQAIAVWRPIEHRVLRAFAHLAPTILGTLLAVIWLVAGIELTGWRWIAAIGLGIYALPSLTDIQGALGRQQAQQEQQ